MMGDYRRCIRAGLGGFETANTSTGLMRVAFITTFASYYRKPLFETLDQRWDVDFVFFSAGNEWYRSPHMTHQPGRVTSTALRPRNIRGLAYVPNLGQIIRRGQYDVIVKCLNGKVMVPFTYLCARAVRVPIVLWTGMWDHPSSVFHRLTRPLVMALYRRSDAIVAYGEHVKRYLVSEAGVQPSKVFVAGQAVEGERFAAAASDGGYPPHVLYVGQLEERKGVRYLVDAFKSLHHKRARLRLIGSGSLRSWLEREAACDPRIEVVGYRSQQDLPREYARVRCVVVPSIHTAAGREPWGLVVNEAMHAMRPVVATRSVGAAAGGLVEHGRNGYVIPERDVDALTHALDALVCDEKLARELGERGGCDVARFSHHAMADAFEKACLYATARAKYVAR